MTDSKQAGPVSLQELADEYRRLADTKTWKVKALETAKKDLDETNGELRKIEKRLGSCVGQNVRRQVFGLQDDIRVLIVECCGPEGEGRDFTLEEIHRMPTQ